MTIATSTYSMETWIIFPSLGERERKPTSTVGGYERKLTSTLGGDYALPSLAEEDDTEVKAWADLARRSRERWARENPY